MTIAPEAAADPRFPRSEPTASGETIYRTT
jgi:hypothetical protein